MAYNKEKIKKELLANVEADEHISTFEDAAATVKPSRQTLYDWEFDKLDKLKSLIENNKRQVKHNLRKQWAKETASPTLQLALYKILATNEERRALQMEYREHSGEVGIKKIERTIVDPKDE